MIEVMRKGDNSLLYKGHSLEEAVDAVAGVLIDVESQNVTSSSDLDVQKELGNIHIPPEFD